jgi:hypothetical protein
VIGGCSLKRFGLGCSGEGMWLERDGMVEDGVCGFGFRRRVDGEFPRLALLGVMLVVRDDRMERWRYGTMMFEPHFANPSIHIILYTTPLFVALDA